MVSLPSTPQTCQIPQKKHNWSKTKCLSTTLHRKKVIMINQRNFLSTNPKTKCVCRPGLPSQSIKNGDLFFVQFQSIFKLKTPKTRNKIKIWWQTFWKKCNIQLRIGEKWSRNRVCFFKVLNFIPPTERKTLNASLKKIVFLIFFV